MKVHIYNFEKLEIWNLAMEFADYIYDVTNTFPPEEKYGLSSQLRRAATSISANIAEGSCKTSYKEKKRFMEIAYGSTIEVLNHCMFSRKRNYIDEETISKIRIIVNELTNKINGFNNNLIMKIKTSKEIK
jgi:four helix bundle protein